MGEQVVQVEAGVERQTTKEVAVAVDEGPRSTFLPNEERAKP